MSDATIIGAVFALILFVSIVCTFVLWACCVVGKRRDAADDAAHDLPHGDVVRLPIGATPRSLVEQFHDCAVPETGQRDHG